MSCLTADPYTTHTRPLPQEPSAAFRSAAPMGDKREARNRLSAEPMGNAAIPKMFITGKPLRAVYQPRACRLPTRPSRPPSRSLLCREGPGRGGGGTGDPSRTRLSFENIIAREGNTRGRRGPHQRSACMHASRATHYGGGFCSLPKILLRVRALPQSADTLYLRGDITRVCMPAKVYSDVGLVGLHESSMAWSTESA